jgi:uncharacterized membrane protein
VDAETRLVDPAVADISTAQAIGFSAAGLALAWLAYDAACRLLRDDRLVAAATAVLVVLSAYAASELFAPRAAFLQVGAMLGTIMAANVLLVIIPAHWELIDANREGREPDPEPGLRAKQRSVHNNYLTLPVIFTMLAGHFPLAFGADNAWLVLLAIFVLVAGIRHFFNLWHVGRRAWWIPAAAAVGALALVVVLAPEDTPATDAPTDEAALAIVTERCATCHSGAAAPNGVRLESLAHLEQHADAVEAQVSARSMPPGNATGMTDDERQQLVAWASAAG